MSLLSYFPINRVPLEIQYFQQSIIMRYLHSVCFDLSKGCPVLAHHKLPVMWDYNNLTLKEVSSPEHTEGSGPKQGPQYRMLVGGRVIEVNTLQVEFSGRYRCWTLINSTRQMLSAWMYVQIEGEHYIWTLPGWWLKFNASNGVQKSFHCRLLYAMDYVVHLGPQSWTGVLENGPSAVLLVGIEELGCGGFTVSIWMERLFSQPCVSTYQNQSLCQSPATDRTALPGTLIYRHHDVISESRSSNPKPDPAHRVWQGFKSNSARYS